MEQSSRRRRIAVTLIWSMKDDLMKLVIINSAPSCRCYPCYKPDNFHHPSTEICYLFVALAIFIKSWFRLKLMLPQINKPTGIITYYLLFCFLIDKITFCVIYIILCINISIMKGFLSKDPSSPSLVLGSQAENIFHWSWIVNMTDRWRRWRHLWGSIGTCTTICRCIQIFLLKH